MNMGALVSKIVMEQMEHHDRRFMENAIRLLIIPLAKAGVPRTELFPSGHEIVLFESNLLSQEGKFRMAKRISDIMKIHDLSFGVNSQGLPISVYKGDKLFSLDSDDGC